MRVTELPDFLSELLDFLSELPEFLFELPDFLSELPDFLSDQPYFLSELPEFLSELPDLLSELAERRSPMSAWLCTLPSCKHSSSLSGYVLRISCKHSTSLPGYVPCIPANTLPLCLVMYSAFLQTLYLSAWLCTLHSCKYSASLCL